MEHEETQRKKKKKIKKTKNIRQKIKDKRQKKGFNQLIPLRGTGSH
jgi:hypothetical protein